MITRALEYSNTSATVAMNAGYFGQQVDLPVQDLAAIHTCESVLAVVAALAAPQRQIGEERCVRSQWTPP